MATRASKPALSVEELLPPLPPEGPELDALIKLKVAEADANPAPGIAMADVFDSLRRHHAERVMRGA